MRSKSGMAIFLPLIALFLAVACGQFVWAERLHADAVFGSYCDVWIWDAAVIVGLCVGAVYAFVSAPTLSVCLSRMLLSLAVYGISLALVAAPLFASAAQVQNRRHWEVSPTLQSDLPIYLLTVNSLILRVFILGALVVVVLRLRANGARC